MLLHTVHIVMVFYCVFFLGVCARRRYSDTGPTTSGSITDRLGPIMWRLATQNTHSTVSEAFFIKLFYLYNVLRCITGRIKSTIVSNRYMLHSKCEWRVVLMLQFSHLGSEGHRLHMLIHSLGNNSIRYSDECQQARSLNMSGALCRHTVNAKS